MKKETMMEARKFQNFLSDLGIKSPIQDFDSAGDEIICVTAQVVVMVSKKKAIVTWMDDASVEEYLLEEEGNPMTFRAFRECKEIPKYSIMRDVAEDAPVKVYQIRHAATAAAAM